MHEHAHLMTKSNGVISWLHNTRLGKRWIFFFIFCCFFLLLNLGIVFLLIEFSPHCLKLAMSVCYTASMYTIVLYVCIVRSIYNNFEKFCTLLLQTDGEQALLIDATLWRCRSNFTIHSLFVAVTALLSYFHWFWVAFDSTYLCIYLYPFLSLVLALNLCLRLNYKILWRQMSDRLNKVRHFYCLFLLLLLQLVQVRNFFSSCFGDGWAFKLHRKSNWFFINLFLSFFFLISELPTEEGK